MKIDDVSDVSENIKATWNFYAFDKCRAALGPAPVLHFPGKAASKTSGWTTFKRLSELQSNGLGFEPFEESVQSKYHNLSYNLS